MKIRILRLRRPDGRSFAWRFVQRLLLILGLVAVGVTAYTYVARYAYQTYTSWQFDGSLARSAAAARLAQSSAVRPPVPVALKSVMGRIAIPRLGISAIIKEGVDDRTLNLAVGHIPSTALPGQTGNVGLAAHRDTLFRNLKDVKDDDAVTLTTLDGVYAYRVVKFKIVKATDVSVLAPTPGEKTLTLVTCYPFYFVGHAPWRFIVTARLESSNPDSSKVLASTVHGDAELHQ